MTLNRWQITWNWNLYLQFSAGSCWRHSRARQYFLEASEAEVMMLRDNLLAFAKDNLSSATVTISSKDYANEFKVSSPLPSFDFYLQFIQATFLSLSHSDPIVSKDILYGKVLPILLSSCLFGSIYLNLNGWKLKTIDSILSCSGFGNYCRFQF